MRDHLRAGIAVYNAGEYHAAHDAWEDHWLDLERGTDDELFLHGLIQFTAAVYHAHEGNPGGATGLAGSAREYLADLPADYRGVNVGAVRDYLADVAEDPAFPRENALELTHEGTAIGFEDLDLPATAVAAEVLAEEFGYDEDAVERAAEYALADLAAGDDGSRFITLLFDFVRDGENRPIVSQRLGEHVQRRRARESDVDGLFEEK